MTPEAAIDRLCSAAFSNLRKHTWFHRMERDEQDELVTIITVAITETRASALRVPANHVRDENGVDMRVLGTLPVTADDVIVMDGEQVYHPDADGSFRLIVRPACEHDAEDKDFPLPDDCEWVASYSYYEHDNGYSQYETYDIRQCYSTRDAALAARKEGAKDE